MKPKVVVAEKIAQAGIESLEEEFDVVLAIGMEREALLPLLSDAVGLVVRSATDVDLEMLEAGPDLQVIGRAGIGVDNIDLDEATSRGILVVNAPNANTISAAEHTMALLLSQARNVAAADASLRSGAWERGRFQGVELHGKVLGVIGLGRIGTLVAQRALSFGMELRAYDPFVAEERVRRLGVEPVELEVLLSEADFITVHLPLTDETRGLLDADGLAQAKPGVRIVNTSRGGIIDEQALADAVKAGRVAGAALDVFAAEPMTESPLFDLPEVVVTPHLGASTTEAQDKAGTDVADAVAAALRGELVLSAVNLDLGRGVTDEVGRHLLLAEELGKVFMSAAGQMPEQLRISVEGRLAGEPVQPLGLAVTKGLVSAATDEPVSFVNAPTLAERWGLGLSFEMTEQSRDYVSLVRLSTTDENGEEVAVAGTITQKGMVLTEMFGHHFELPLGDHLLVARNDDVPGVIGRIGTFVGDLGINIADMVVGRPDQGTTAVMGLVLDRPIPPEELTRLIALDGIVTARSI
ncbi:MAG: phosphoglycerate dehydrogenase [Acidimicrobiia bacterium]|nr:phosphoglycerate dehydrogenase [Acidimicrobiia bacterium]